MFVERILTGSAAQELNQADISVLRKAELKERFAKARKAFDDENKAREKAANKIVSATKGCDTTADAFVVPAGCG